MSDFRQLPPPPADRPAIPPPPEVPEAAASHEPAADVVEASPERRSHASLWIGIFLILALAGGAVAVALWVSRPEPCADTNLRSTRFGYCLTVPAGWRVADVQGMQLPQDQLIRPADAGTVTVQAVRTGRTLGEFVADLRAAEQDAGLQLAEVSNTTVDGVEARQWDAELPSRVGGLRSRDVVFVRDGVVWRLQFADTAHAFSSDLADLAKMLRSWRFA